MGSWIARRRLYGVIVDILESAREGLYCVNFTWDMGNGIDNFFSLILLWHAYECDLCYSMSQVRDANLGVAATR